MYVALDRLFREGRPFFLFTFSLPYSTNHFINPRNMMLFWKRRKDPDTWRSAIRAHYKRAWKSSYNILHVAEDAYPDLPPAFSVLEFPPTAARNRWCYATCGMSVPEDVFAMELHICSAARDARLADLLAFTASHHRTCACLGLHQVINFGYPWQPGSACDHGYITQPDLDGPKLESFKITKEKILFCYWLVPITEAERNYIAKEGTEALEAAFGKGFNYMDATRSSVV